MAIGVAERTAEWTRKIRVQLGLQFLKRKQESGYDCHGEEISLHHKIQIVI